MSLYRNFFGGIGNPSDADRNRSVDALSRGEVYAVEVEENR